MRLADPIWWKPVSFEEDTERKSSTYYDSPIINDHQFRMNVQQLRHITADPNLVTLRNIRQNDSRAELLFFSSQPLLLQQVGLVFEHVLHDIVANLLVTSKRLRGLLEFLDDLRSGLERLRDGDGLGLGRRLVADDDAFFGFLRKRNRNILLLLFAIVANPLACESDLSLMELDPGLFLDFREPRS